jgi:hypothetical protein
MRKDMSKVIVERPRRSGFGDPKRSKSFARHELAKIQKQDWLSIDDDEFDHDLFSVERMKNRMNANKELNENLSPLVRFLESSVGRPWNDVYSEIRENVSPKSAVQFHIMEHVRGYVITDTYLGEDGEVYRTKTGHFERTQSPLSQPGRYANHFYVHPVSGLLCLQKRVSRREWKERHKEPKVFPLSEFRQFRFIDGRWKVVELAKFQHGNPEEAPTGTAVAYVNERRMFVDEYNHPDALFPSGLDARKRYSEYGSYDLYALFVRDVGVREQKALKEFLKEKNEAE